MQNCVITKSRVYKILDVKFEIEKFEIYDDFSVFKIRHTGVKYNLIRVFLHELLKLDLLIQTL